MPMLNTVKQINQGQKILVYGPPKTGKTKLAGELAEAGFHLLWLDLEKGAVTLINHLSDEAKSRIQLIQIEDTKEVPRAIETVANIFGKPNAKHNICALHGRINCPDCKRSAEAQWDTVCLGELGPNWVLVIDSGSQLSDSAMAFYTKDVKGFDLADTLGEYSRVEFKHYDAQGRVLSAILSGIQAARFHVLMITHEVSIDQEDNTEKIVPRFGTKNLSKTVAKYFDHVVYCSMANKKHLQQSATTDSNKVLMGSRSNLSIANGATLADLLNGKVEKITAPKESTTRTFGKGQ